MPFLSVDSVFRLVQTMLSRRFDCRIYAPSTRWSCFIIRCLFVAGEWVWDHLIAWRKWNQPGRCCCGQWFAGNSAGISSGILWNSLTSIYLLIDFAFSVGWADASFSCRVIRCLFVIEWRRSEINQVVVVGFNDWAGTPLDNLVEFQADVMESNLPPDWFCFLCWMSCCQFFV